MITRDDAIQMAKEAEGYYDNPSECWMFYQEELERFAQSCYQRGVEDAIKKDVIECLTDAEQTAMKFTLMARIPECGYFGEIAQNLSYALQEIRALKGEQK